MSRVVRIARLARRIGGEFRGHGLAHDHRAGAAQQSHHCRIAIRQASGVQHRAILGGHVGGVDDVLDAHRHAVQRARRESCGALLVGAPRLSQDMLRVEKCPGLYLTLAFLDLFQTG